MPMGGWSGWWRQGPCLGGLPSGVEIPCRGTWPVVLRAGALVLRPLGRRDEAAWSDLRTGDWEWLRPWEPTAPPQAGPGSPSVSQVRRRMADQAAAGSALPWVMAWDPGWPRHPSPVARTVLIGAVTVSGITYGSARLASVGYWIASRWAGRGLTPLGAALALDYCAGVLRLHRVEVAVRPENAKSLRVVAKLGLREEGLRPRYLHIDGDWRDHRVFALDADGLAQPVTARVLQGRGVPVGEDGLAGVASA